MSGSHTALHHVPYGAMMAGHFLLLGFRRCVPRRGMMMPAMRQAAHPVAVGHAGIIRARQQRQRRCQQRDDHENSLHTAHRRKFYHRLSRPAASRILAPPISPVQVILSRGGLPPPSCAKLASTPAPQLQPLLLRIFLEPLISRPTSTKLRTLAREAIPSCDLRQEKHRGTLAPSCCLSN
jgi:hypothetical protein